MFTFFQQSSISRFSNTKLCTGISRPAIPKSTLPLSAYSYSESFETSDPTTVWFETAGKTSTVHEKGQSTDYVKTGTYSLKIDITLEAAHGVWWSFPDLDIPTDLLSEQQLVFHADTYITANAGIISVGTGSSIGPTYSGKTEFTVLADSNTLTQWVTTEDDLIENIRNAADTFLATRGGATYDDVGMWTNYPAIFIYSITGGRFTFYVDNISITGTAPDSTDYGTEATTAWNNYINNIVGTVSDMRDALDAFDDSSVSAFGQSWLAAAQTAAATIYSSTTSTGYPTVSEWDEIAEYYNGLTYLYDATGNDIDIIPWDATSGTKTITTTFPVMAALATTLNVFAAKGEITCSSFIVRSNAAITDLQLTVNNLSDGTNTLNASAIDPFVVVCWYQGNALDNIIMGTKALVPELLVKDDTFVVTDTDAETSELRTYNGATPVYIDVTDSGVSVPTGYTISDAETIQPFSMDTDTNKQIYLRITIPSDAVAGDYTGTINLSDGVSIDTDITLNITVYPFSLASSVVQQSIYYKATIAASPAQFSTTQKSATQYQIEMQDLYDHGITHPVLAETPGHTYLTDSMDIKAAIGFPMDTIYCFATSTGSVYNGEKTISDIITECNLWVTNVGSYGFDTYYFYGKDEAGNQVILDQIDWWNTIRAESSAFKVAASITAPQSQWALGYLDRFILLGRTALPYKYYHDVAISNIEDSGEDAFSYSNPQAGIENPYLYRMNYGLQLVAHGYAGAMTYAYQHGFGDSI